MQVGGLEPPKSRGTEALQAPGIAANRHLQTEEPGIEPGSPHGVGSFRDCWYYHTHPLFQETSTGLEPA